MSNHRLTTLGFARIPPLFLGLALLMGMALLSGGCATLTGDAKVADAEQNLTPAAHERMADGLSARGQNEVALTHYNKVLLAEPDNGNARFKKAALLDRQGVFDAALGEYLEIVKRHPATPLAARAHESAALLLFKAKLFKRGAEHANKALQADEALWRARMLLGVFHNYQDRHKLAEADFKKALTYSPDNPEILNNLGMTYSLSNHPVDSVKTFAAALRNARPGPQEARIANNLGLALCRMQRYDEALDAFNRAGGGAAKAQNNVGYYLYKTGLYEKSLEYFEKALAIAPSYYDKAADNLERAKLALRVEGAVRDAGDQPVPFMDRNADPAGARDGGRSTVPDPAPMLQSPSQAPDTPQAPLESQLPDLQGQLDNTELINRPQLHNSQLQQGSPEQQNSPGPKGTLRRPDLVTRPAIQPIALTQPAALAAPATFDRSVPAPAVSQRATLPGYSVHVSSWRTESSAHRHLEQLTRQGEAAWTGQVDLGERGMWHRVYVGAFGNEQEADAVRDRLQEDKNLRDARVVCPAAFAISPAQGQRNREQQEKPNVTPDPTHVV